MALAKRFTMAYSEHHFIQFRLEAFNVFNHPVWVRRTETSWRVRHFRGRPPMPRIRGFGVQVNDPAGAPASTRTEVFVLSDVRESNAGGSRQGEIKDVDGEHCGDSRTLTIFSAPR